MRRFECPRRLVEAVCAAPRSLRDRRVLALVVRHPACPQQVAWDALPGMLWRDLHQVCSDPRTPPGVRAQAERKLVERLPNLTLGERIALAKIATRGVIRALYAEAEPRCVQALLDNPLLTETDAMRLLNANPVTECLQALMRHPRWGQRPGLVRAAVRLPKLPLAMTLSLVVALPDHELANLVRAPEVSEPLRTALVDLLIHRKHARMALDATPP